VTPTPAHLQPETPLRFVRGVGPARARQLAEAGYHTVGDLLLHIPRRYEDRRRLRPIGELRAPGLVTLRGRLARVHSVRTRRGTPGGRGFSLVRGLIVDETGTLPAVWFNRPYLPGWVEDGVDYLLHGELRPMKKGGFELVNPSCERAEEALAAGRVVPVYPQAGELGPAVFRRLLGGLLADFDPLAWAPDPLPAELRRRHGLPPLGEALAFLHAPDEGADVDLLNRRRTPAHLRLIYGELFELQLAVAERRARETAEPKAHTWRLDADLRRRLAALLPFPLTGAQRRVLGEIFADLAAPRPMLRLLQGDVGCGKTAVAALTLAAAAENGLQGAFMAPTELLAEQHFRNLLPLLGGSHPLALLTGSGGRLTGGGGGGEVGAEAVRQGLARGEIPLVIGTHALIEETVVFAHLGVAIIDEQHRFGVAQRRRLKAKGDRPDLLVMTATPIPRSLALTLHGDLDLSLLDESPPGRKPVTTTVLPAQRRDEAYQRLREALATGEQAYVVFPRIEGGEQIDVASLAREGEQVREILSGFTTAVIHGGLGSEEREAILTAFAAGEVRALLATTVIEVGIDVAQATWIVLEGAERFGLAQLHQLRGRVGRGGRPGHCVALHGPLTDEARKRLKIFAATTDGFRLAEEDLRLRGPGDLAGSRQAGLPTLRAADLSRDWEWLLAAREDARQRVALATDRERG